MKLTFFSAVYFLVPFKGIFKESETPKVEILKRKPLRVIPCESVSYSHRKWKNKRFLEVV